MSVGNSGAGGDRPVGKPLLPPAILNHHLGQSKNR